MRRFIPAIIFSVIFTLLFPYSLMAQTPEQKGSEYQIPESSLSYLAQAQNVNQPVANTTDTAAPLSNSDRQALEPEFEPQTPVSIEIIPEPAPTKPQKQNKAEIAGAKTKVKAGAHKDREAARLSVAATSQPPESTEKPVVTAASEKRMENPLFSEALTKMQQNSAQRQAEAARLGIVLPSQGGDMAAVSPSLSKMQQTLKSIMAR